MELRQLQTFREVVRAGSFTAAARTLHMTQPSVSLHIRSLERELGARLMERDARGVRLTAAGEMLAETTDRVLADMGDVVRRIREKEAPERGTVRLACGDTVALRLLPPVLGAFRGLRPQAEVAIRNHGSQRILDLVLHRDVDLGIVTLPASIDPALWARTLLEERFWLALPAGHALATEASPALSLLEGEPAVFLAPPSETRVRIDEGLEAAGTAPDVVMESGNLEVVKAYVADGLGLSILPEMSITEADREQLVIRPLPDDFPRRRLALVRRSDTVPGLLATDLLRLLAEHLRAPDA